MTDKQQGRTQSGTFSHSCGPLGRRGSPNWRKEARHMPTIYSSPGRGRFNAGVFRSTPDIRKRIWAPPLFLAAALAKAGRWPAKSGCVRLGSRRACDRSSPDADPADHHAGRKGRGWEIIRTPAPHLIGTAFKSSCLTDARNL